MTTLAFNKLQAELTQAKHECQELAKCVNLLQQVIELDKLMYGKIKAERDEWRGIACKFANTTESIIGETPYDVMLKKDLVSFKEILNKYKEV